MKRYYFEKEAQVLNLQDTVASQRMAGSNTVLDDNEYINRFSRLEASIKDLSFSIRKDWKEVPSWLEGSITSDANAKDTKEMMAVGRAAISRWLVDEVFNRYFHPALDIAFSEQLKRIERNLRWQSTKANTEEDKGNEVTRITNWRRTTTDGLSDILKGEKAEENRAHLVSLLVEQLREILASGLSDPAPTKLESGALMVIENTVNICEKVPLESRDVCVEYFLPGENVDSTFVKVETGLPPLTAAGQQPSEGGRASTERSGSPVSRPSGRREIPSTSAGGTGPAALQQKESKWPWKNKKRAAGTDNNTSSQSPEPIHSPLDSNSDEKETAEDSEKRETAGRVRLACFPSVVIKGKGPSNPIVKPSVYLID